MDREKFDGCLFEKFDGFPMGEFLVMFILVKLELKSLLRCKCVCKHWLAIIESSRFINYHYNNPDNKQQLLIYHRDVETYQDVMSYYADDGKLLSNDQPIHLQLPVQTPNAPGHLIDQIIGPIAGVFCMVTRMKRFVMWNPARRSFYPIPLHRPESLPPPYRCYLYTFGFWFDLLNNEYKVVWIQSYETAEAGDFYESLVVSVYSSITDSWRYFEDDIVLENNWSILYGHGNIYLKGFIYWWAERAVVTFDVSTEVFNEIQYPDAVQSQSQSRRDAQLSLLNNTVALICFNNPTSSEKWIDIWLMLQVEGGRSWSKYMTIAPILGADWKYVGLCNNKFFITTDSLEMISYDLETKETFTLEAPVQGWGVTSPYIFSYKESLVPVQSRGNKDHEEFNRDSAEKDFLTYNRDFLEHVKGPTSSQRRPRKYQQANTSTDATLGYDVLC